MTSTKRTDLRKPRGPRRPLTGPDLLTLARFPLAGGILVLALAASAPPRWPLVTLFALGIASDVIDGPWARRLGVNGERGARLDSAADGALAVAVAVAAVRVAEWPAGQWAWWAIAGVATVRLVCLGVTLARFRVVSIAHTLANKATGIVVGAVAMGALASSHVAAWTVGAACAIAAFAAIEELVMTATSRAYSRDRRGWWDGTHGPGE